MVDRPAVAEVRRRFQHVAGQLVGVGVPGVLGVGEGDRRGVVVVGHALVVGDLVLGLRVGAGPGGGGDVLVAAPLAVGPVLRLDQLVVVVVPGGAGVGVAGVGAR